MTGLLDILWTTADVPPQERHGVVSYPHDVDMRTPSDLSVDGDAQIFSLVCGSKNIAVHGWSIGSDAVPLVGDADHCTVIPRKTEFS